MIADARFTADACALCVASASLLTERVRGMRLDAVTGVDERWLFASLEGEPPAARRKCATLPLDTLHRAASNLRVGGAMIVGLLLAAGGGTRFGSQKLLARVHGVPIVATAARTLAPLVDRLIVVVGSEAQAVTDALAGIDATLVENPRWADGLSTSLAAGVEAAPKETKAVIVALGDQPGIDPAVVRKVIARWRETGRPIVSTRYRGNRGHPVLLGCSVFGEVGAISGDVGARSLMERDASRVAFVDVDADAPPDVDTPDDLAALDA